MVEHDAFDLLHPKVRELALKRFGKPTEIQNLAIPVILRKENALIIAGTGFGKTEAAMLPVFSRLVENNYKKISVLYITPLRALNRDMFSRLFWWADRLDLEVSIRHGDTLTKERAEQRETPPDILITTPESLQAILPGRRMRRHLSNVRWVIIDEVHELVSNKRGVQLSLAIERLSRIARFQLVGLSATIGSEEAASKYLKGATVVKGNVKKDLEIEVLFPDVKKEDEELAEEVLLPPAAVSRLRAILKLTSDKRSTLIFTNTREAAELLTSRLKTLAEILSKQTREIIEVHHSSLSRESRIKAERKFKAGELKAIVATSSLELGIDIGAVDFVIQYSSPRQVTKLLQRIGRSLHRVGERSRGVIIASEEDLHECVAINTLAREGRIEELKIPSNCLDVLAHQIAGILLEENETEVTRLFEMVKRAYPFSNLDYNEFLRLLSFMESLNLIRVSEGRVRKRRKTWTYYYENLSTIPDKTEYKIIDISSREAVGKLDEDFVAEHCYEGSAFVCRGAAWRVVSVEEGKVLVEPCEELVNAVPSWEGELIPVSREVAEEVVNIFNADIKRHESELDEKLRRFVERQKKFFTPSSERIFVENYKEFTILHCFFGSLINETLANYLSALLTEKFGRSVRYRATPYAIVIEDVLDANEIEKLLSKGDVGDAVSIISEYLESTRLFKQRFIRVAKRFGVISRDATLDRLQVNKLITIYKGTPIHSETLNEIFFEKMDVPNTLEILRRIKKGKIKIARVCGRRWIKSRAPSPLAKLALVEGAGEILVPKEPKKIIYDAFKHRLLNTKVLLVCMNCGNYSVVKPVKSVEEYPSCKVCGSRLIGVLHPKRREYLKIIKRKLTGCELKKDEERAYKRVRRTADLVITYGKRAVVTLSGRGIGPETAARILSKLPKNEEALLRAIFEAEKQFSRTKKYWSL